MAALRGYGYQLYASGLAWLGLQDGETLYLEVAEDFAVASRDSLAGTQVKDTAASGSVTLQSAGIRAAIDSFVDLVSRNPSQRVSLHYLTTSPVGREQRLDDRPGGRPGLEYWRLAAAGADVGPLRRILETSALEGGTLSHLRSLSDDAFRSDLLGRIHWICGAPGIDDVRADLSAGLVELVASARGLSSRTGRALVPVVLERLLSTAVSTGPRRLRRADLLELIDEVALVAVPVERLVALDQGGGATFGRPSLLVAAAETPMPATLAPRSAIVGTLEVRRRAAGIAVVCGGTGMGKSLVARMAAAATSAPWAIVDFRNLGPADTASRLMLVMGELAISSSVSLILDDLNEADDPAVRDLLPRLAAALRRRDATAIVTAYRPPAPATLHRLPVGVAPLEIPYLDEEEVGALVVAMGGEERYAGLVHAAAAGGHPQLAMAILYDLAATDWSRAALARVLGGGQQVGVRAERNAVRQRLVAAMPEDAQRLLIRTSLIGGAFSRKLALSVADGPPPVPMPGLVLDRLVGPWLETFGRGRLRVSPLLESAALEILSAGECRSVHHLVAHALMIEPDLSVLDAGMLMRHALMSGDGKLVGAFAQSVIRCGAETLDVLAPFVGELRRLPVDGPTFPGDLAASAMLRLAQLLTLLPEGARNEAMRCREALERERVHVKGEELFESLYLSKVLLHPRAGEIFPDWLELNLRFDALLQTRPRLARVGADFRSRAGGSPHVSGVLFAGQMRSILTVRRFREIVERLDREADAVRVRMLSSFQRGRGDVSILVNHGGMAESRTDGFDWEAAAADYAACADIAASWPNPMLATRCAIAQAVCYDDHGGDPDRALACLADAESRFGADVALARARAKVHWRRRDHAAALPLLAAAAKEGGQDQLERAFIAREAGISAAELGDWDASWRWFDKAQAEASGIGLPSVRATAIGLLADAAHAACRAGRPDVSVARLRDALDALPGIDPDGTLQEAHCHRVVRHAVLWLFRERTSRLAGDGEEVHYAPGCASNSDPNEAIRSHPLAALDLTFYFLAEIDEGLAEPTGFFRVFRTHLVEGPVLSSETSMAILHDHRAIARHDPTSFADRVRRHASMAEVLASRGRLTGNEILDPPRGEIPLAVVDRDAPEVVLRAAEDFLLSFAISAAVARAFERLDEALAQVLAATELAALHPLAERMLGSNTELRNDREGAAIAVNALRTEPTLRVPEFYWTGVWLVLHLRISKLRSGVSEPLVKWLFAGWAYLVGGARFRLVAPNVTASAVEAVLSGAARTPAAAAKLLLAAAPTAATSMPTVVRECLEELATSE